MSIRPLSPALQESAKKNLNEVPERVAEDIKHVKEWLKKQPHMNARQDDQWILAFLRGCKFSLERTKEKLDAYYSVRNLAPEFYGSRDPFQKDLQETLKQGFSLPLLEPTPDGKRALLIRSSLFEPGKINLDLAYKHFALINDILLNEDDIFCVNGTYNIIDLQYMTMSKMTSISPTQLKKMTIAMQQCFPVRPKAALFLNAPPFFETLYKLMLTFMPEKFKKRMVLISREDYDKLFEYVPKKLIPPEYGGSGQRLEELIAHWQKKAESYKDWLKEDEKYGTNEKKRPGKPKTSEEMFGLEGSFRKLNVD